MGKRRWTDEKLELEALKYNTLQDFKKNNRRAHDAAYDRGILHSVCGHMTIRKPHSLKALKIEALKYQTRKEFYTKSSRHYHSAHKKGIIDKICKHMVPSISAAYTLKELKTIAKSCKTRGELRNKYPGAYSAILKTNILDDTCKHMKESVTAPWTLEDLKKEALKYQTRKEFKKQGKCAYMYARKKGLLDSICGHMRRLIRCNYTIENLHQEALKYKTRNEFSDKSVGAYARARKWGLLDHICNHMPIISNDSLLEKELINALVSHYPTIKKFRDYGVKIPNKPWIKGFEIDIYVDELKKGIEFDGKYHHSVEGLKRSHKKWPTEDLPFYHKIKDAYFESKGIKIIHIKEENWLKNKVKCIQKCLEFLSKTS